MFVPTTQHDGCSRHCFHILAASHLQYGLFLRPFMAFTYLSYLRTEGILVSLVIEDVLNIREIV